MTILGARNLCRWPGQAHHLHARPFISPRRAGLRTLPPAGLGGLEVGGPGR
jgi:hypothetical protein